MTGGRPTRFNSFTCPNCNALYQLVRVEAGPETVVRGPTCRDCAAPFPARDGKFVLKYFILRQAARIKRWRRPRPRGVTHEWLEDKRSRRGVGPRDLSGAGPSGVSGGSVSASPGRNLSRTLCQTLYVDDSAAQILPTSRRIVHPSNP
jgi:hypothetical protein